MVSVVSPPVLPLALSSQRLLLAATVLIVLIVVPAAFAQDVAKRTTVQITSPSSLQKEGGYEHLEALFGDYPRRWATVEANLIYIGSELCDSEDIDGFFHDGFFQDMINNTDVTDDICDGDDDDDANLDDYYTPEYDDDDVAMLNYFDCQEQKKDAIFESLKSLFQGNILMVDRGSCTFVKKVRNAQKLGAVAVIIADNVCLCRDTDCMNQATKTSYACDTKPPILADDGSGDDIFIPSFLLYKADADRIKESSSSNSSNIIQSAVAATNSSSSSSSSNVVTTTMKLEWAQDGFTEKVEYDLWTTPSVRTQFDLSVMTFLSNLDRALGVDDAAKFTPHQQILDGVAIHCRSSINGDNYCEDLCTNQGRYCAYEDDDWVEVSGKDFVVEKLRRLCIRDVYNYKDDDDNRAASVWWNYTLEFAKKCDTEDFFNNYDCVKGCMNTSGINSTLIENCMSQSGGTDQDVRNTLLSNEMDLEQHQMIADGKFLFLPALLVNGRYANPNNELTPTFVLDAICGDYFAESAPEVCRNCKDSTDVAECVSNFNGISTIVGDIMIVTDGAGLGNDMIVATTAGGMRAFMMPASLSSFAVLVLVGILSGLALFGLV